MHTYRFERPAPSTSAARGERRGFTLIKLLVVVISAILAAILFPVFAQARGKARQETCISNQRQLGVGMLAYVQDHDETLPISNYPDPGGASNTSWQYAIAPYVKANFPQTVNQSAGKSLSIYACPDFVDDAANAHPSSSYNRNEQLFGSLDASLSAANRNLAVSLAEIDAPAQVVFLAESTVGCVWTVSADDPASFAALGATLKSCTRNYLAARARHSGGGANLLGDGHAKWFKAPEPSFSSTGSAITPVAPSAKGVAYRRSLTPTAAAWVRED